MTLPQSTKCTDLHLSAFKGVEVICKIRHEITLKLVSGRATRINVHVPLEINMFVK